MSTPSARHARRGFTLVELLVVIGIIALLISILLPTLNNARSAAMSVACLSNQRQINLGLLFYTNDNKGYIPPVEYISPDNATPGRWFHTILSDTGALEGTNDDNNVYMCPAGLDEEADPSIPGREWWNAPASQDDGKGGMFMRVENSAFDSGAGTERDLRTTNYALNGHWPSGNAWWEPSNGEPYSFWFPAGFIDYREATSDAKPTRLRKLTSFEHDSTKITLMFDGLWILALRPESIHLRHRNGTASNFLFIDGHAASVQYKGIPPGANDPFGREATNMYGGEYNGLYPDPNVPSQYDYDVLFYTKPLARRN